jgi:hypothetical protein
MKKIGPRERFWRRHELPAYLRELSVLAGRSVTEEEVSSLEEVENLRAPPDSVSARTNERKFTMLFRHKTGVAFENYIESLFAANPSPVYIWTHRTRICGAFVLGSIRELNRSFGFRLNEDGIVSVTTTDFRDELVLDWFEEHGRELLEVNARGERWSAVEPPVPVE